MAIDQAFGERGGISPIRFISFPAALTFPFAHSNWQNKIPARLSFLSSTPGNHSSAAAYTLTPLCSSTPPSHREQPHHVGVGNINRAHAFFAEESKECACHRASLQSRVTCTNHLREGHTSTFHFLPITTSRVPRSHSPRLPPLTLPAYLNNSSEVQPSPRIIISISLPGYWPATQLQGVSQPSVLFRGNFFDSSTSGVKRALFKRGWERR